MTGMRIGVDRKGIADLRKRAEGVLLQHGWTPSKIAAHLEVSEGRGEDEPFDENFYAGESDSFIDSLAQDAQTGNRVARHMLRKSVIGRLLLGVPLPKGASEYLAQALLDANADEAFAMNKPRGGDSVSHLRKAIHAAAIVKFLCVEGRDQQDALKHGARLLGYSSAKALREALPKTSLLIVSSPDVCAGLAIRAAQYFLR